MIAVLVWLAQVISGPVAAASPPAFAQLEPPVVLERYAAALAKVREPRVISFDYTLEQTGPRTLSQTHRVYRSGNDERDEMLTVDGKRLTPPKVRIFRDRRDRYAVSLLAPRVADYTFRYLGARKDGHHLDYVFRLTPKTIGPFAITEVTIDGVRFLPLALNFETSLNDGIGTIIFGSNARWWVAYTATARATVSADVAMEKLTFYTYRFPPTLPPSTFTQARRSGSHLAVPATVLPGTIPPGTVQPGAVQPGIVQPKTLQPGADRPKTLQPGAVRTKTLQPEADPLKTLQPGADRPKTLQPGAVRTTTLQPGAVRTPTLHPGAV